MAAHLRGRSGRVHVADVAALPLGVLCAFIGGTTLSATACGLDVMYRAWWYQPMIRWCLRRCNHVICISHATAQEVRTRGVTDDRITIIPCGIDMSVSLPVIDSTPQLLVTVGRLVKRKGIVWFLTNVLPDLLTHMPDLQYVIMGNGPERRRISSIIKKLHLQDAVHLFTHASDDVCRELMQKAALFVAPNIPVAGDMEGFGIVCIEAGRAGLPVAAADLEGLKDAVIDGKTGIFFTAGDAQDCTEVIQRMLRNPLNKSDVRQAVTERFAWQTLVPFYNNVFDA